MDLISLYFYKDFHFLKKMEEAVIHGVRYKLGLEEQRYVIPLPDPVYVDFNKKCQKLKVFIDDDKYPEVVKFFKDIGFQRTKNTIVRAFMRNALDGVYTANCQYSYHAEFKQSTRDQNVFVNEKDVPVVPNTKGSDLIDTEDIPSSVKSIFVNEKDVPVPKEKREKRNVPLNFVPDVPTDNIQKNEKTGSNVFPDIQANTGEEMDDFDFEPENLNDGDMLSSFF
jgi:hypothetical protein